jgi:hypothetical protein
LDSRWESHKIAAEIYALGMCKLVPGSNILLSEDTECDFARQITAIAKLTCTIAVFGGNLLDFWHGKLSQVERAKNQKL